jgi:hypothetical protein
MVEIDVKLSLTPRNMLNHKDQIILEEIEELIEDRISPKNGYAPEKQAEMLARVQEIVADLAAARGIGHKAPITFRSTERALIV